MVEEANRNPFSELLGRVAEAHKDPSIRDDVLEEIAGSDLHPFLKIEAFLELINNHPVRAGKEDEDLEFKRKAVDKYYSLVSGMTEESWTSDRGAGDAGLHFPQELEDLILGLGGGDEKLVITDVGAGQGVLGRDLKKKLDWGNNAEVQLVEPFPPEEHEEGIIETNAEKLEGVAPSDIIYAMFSLRYFPDKIKAVARILDNLKGGGSFIIYPPRKESLTIYTDKKRGLFGKVWDFFARKLSGYPETMSGSRMSLVDFLKKKLEERDFKFEKLGSGKDHLLVITKPKDFEGKVSEILDPKLVDVGVHPPQTKYAWLREGTEPSSSPRYLFKGGNFGTKSVYSHKTLRL